MTEQAENERICEWLGWKRHHRTASGHQFWSDGSKTDDGNYLLLNAPTFRTGNDMLMLFQKLQTVGDFQLGYCKADEIWYCTDYSTGIEGEDKTCEGSVRAAVLARIGEAKS